jgi:PIN domain nuclease of toxin-antitoxin system
VGQEAGQATVSRVFLDTHVVVWLYIGESKKLSPIAKRSIEKSVLVISPVVKLELAYLYEIGRLREPAESIVEDLTGRIGLVCETADYANVVNRAIGMTWTRDVFDRLVVAHAAMDASDLLSKDKIIRAHYASAIW